MEMGFTPHRGPFGNHLVLHTPLPGIRGYEQQPLSSGRVYGFVNALIKSMGDKQASQVVSPAASSLLLRSAWPAGDDHRVGQNALLQTDDLDN